METLGIIWLISWVLTIIVASKKGEGGVAVISGLLFGPIALIVALVGKGSRKECPYCKELIHKKAIVCPHCQKEITLP